MYYRKYLKYKMKYLNLRGAGIRHLRDTKIVELPRDEESNAQLKRRRIENIFAYYDFTNNPKKEIYEELCTQTIGGILMGLIGDNMDTVKRIISANGGINGDVVPEHPDNPEENHFINIGRNVSNDHILNPYELFMQPNRSNQFCQTHALILSKKTDNIAKMEYAEIKNKITEIKRIIRPYYSDVDDDDILSMMSYFITLHSEINVDMIREHIANDGLSADLFKNIDIDNTINTFEAIRQKYTPFFYGQLLKSYDEVLLFWKTYLSQIIKILGINELINQLNIQTENQKREDANLLPIFNEIISHINNIIHDIVRGINVDENIQHIIEIFLYIMNKNYSKKYWIEDV